MRITAVTVARADAEIAADRLMTAGARAIEERDLADGSVELRTVLAADDAISTQRLGELPAAWRLVFEDIDDAPSEAWREFAQPIVVNDRLIVTPSWRDVEATMGTLVVPIEPAGSFGLGDHPTTRLSADAVDQLVRPGDRVLDVGCGSGVLGIIAALRGAAEVIGTDVAEAAIEATTSNAARNGVADRVTSSSSPLVDLDDPFDLVLANILAPTLVELSSDLRRLTKPGGKLVISGILADHHQHVLDALEPLVVETSNELDGWAAVVLAAPTREPSAR